MSASEVIPPYRMKTNPRRLNFRGPHQQRRASAQGGFSLIEVMIASGVLVVGLLALTSTSLVVNSLDRADEARQAANQALRSTVERVHAISSGLIGADNGWSQAVDDAFAAGGAPGNSFDVNGLQPWTALPSVGSIDVITDETIEDPQLGLPRDLNGDGDAEDGDVSFDAELLPIVIRVRWNTSEGPREMRQGFYLVGM